MARKMCSDECGRPAANNVADNGLCHPCNDYAEWENTHSDDGHGTEFEGSNDTDGCPVCHPELDPRNAPVRAGHMNTIAKTRRSHAGCAHVVTPKARAACRKAGGPKS